jgi:hypothetical protein
MFPEVPVPLAQVTDAVISEADYIFAADPNNPGFHLDIWTHSAVALQPTRLSRKTNRLCVEVNSEDHVELEKFRNRVESLKRPAPRR